MNRSKPANRSKNLRKGIVSAEINSPYLWGIAEYDTHPERIDICVLDQSDNVIFSSHPLSSSTSKKLTSEINKSSIGKFEWHDEDKPAIGMFFLNTLSLLKSGQ